jgi:hypothetical protein
MLPMTRWVCFMLASERGGEVSTGCGHCTLLPGNVVVWQGLHACISELFDDIPRHQNIQSTVVIIPIQLNATVEVAVPSFGESVLFLEAFYQMVDIIFVDVCHTRVVGHQGKRCVPCCVFTQSRHLFAFVVSMRRESIAQQLVC